MASVIQPSFAGGELSPSIYGRVDLARYLTSLKTCRNFMVMPTGGAKNRPGTRLISETKGSGVVRLIPFQFNTEQSYALEIGDGYMRVHTDSGPVLNTTALADTPVWSSGTTYSQWDLVWLGSGTTRYISRISNNLNQSPASHPDAWYPVAPESDGTVGVEFPTPWGVADLANLKYAQSADVITVCHPSHPPQNISRYSDTEWTIEPFAFHLGPFQESNVDRGIVVSSSTTEGVTTLTASKALFTASHVGMLFKLEQMDYGTPWEVEKDVSIGYIRRHDGKYYMAKNAGKTGSLAPSHEADSASDGKVYWIYLHSGFGVAEITAVASDGLSATATITSRMPDEACTNTTTTKTITAVSGASGYIYATSAAHGWSIGGSRTATVSITYLDGGGESKTVSGAYSVYALDADTLTFGDWSDLVGFTTFTSGSVTSTASGTAKASYKWAFGSFGGDQGYPACTVYHQQRQVFAGTTGAPQALWLSRTGSFHDFGVSNPVVSDDQIDATLDSGQVNSIRSMLSMRTLILLSAGGVWSVAGEQSGSSLSPSNRSAALQGFTGANDLPPLGIGNSAVFVQDKGQIVSDLGYEFTSDSYDGNDLLTFAAHLTEGYSIVDWCYQRHPYSMIWAVRSDGVLLSCTYNRKQEVVGWARHDTDGLFENCCCISEGNEDGVYFAVKRGNSRFVERLNTRLVTDIRDAFFVDCGLSFDGRNTTSTTVSLSGGSTWDEADVLTATASTGIFAYPATSDCGDQLVYRTDSGALYKLEILSVSSASVATVRPNCLVPAEYRSVRTDWAWARDTMGGLGHLEGKTVSILADGCKQGPQVVSGAKITLSPPSVKVHAGLGIQADLAFLDISVQGTNLLPKQKNIPQMRLMVQESRGIMAGCDYDHLYEVKTRSNENWDAPPNLVSGVVNVSASAKWSDTGAGVVRQNDPLPITILAVMPELVVGG